MAALNIPVEAGEKLQPGENVPGKEYSMCKGTVIWNSVSCLCLVTHSCLTLCKPMDCRSPGSSVHGDSPGKNTGVGCHALLQGIFPTQGSNTGLTHCRGILYCLSHEVSPTYRVWEAINSLVCLKLGFPHGSVLKELICQCRRSGFDAWVRKTPWRRKWQPISCLENPMDRGTWCVTVHGMAKEWDTN